jgi:tetratricopeptide (TPR) repeat protein
LDGPSESGKTESEDSPHDIRSKTRVEVVALHKEELDVANRFLKDFAGGVDGLGLLGSVYLNHGRSAEAVKCWEKCVEKAPGRPEAYDAMASVALQKGQFQRVVTLSNKALEIRPRMPGARYRLARALLGLGKAEEAVDVLAEDIRLIPRAANSYFFLGRAYSELGQYEQARESFLRAIELQPKHMQGCYQMATVCQRLDRPDEAEQYRKKFQALKAAARKDLRGRKGQESELVDLAAVRRSVASTQTVAAKLYRRHGKLQRAGQLWQRAIQLDPNNAQFHADFGVLHAQAGEFGAAERALKKAIELAPDRYWGYQGLAKVYLAQNIQLSEAKKLAQAAVRLAPLASNYFILARARNETGDLAGALAAMERTVALEPGNAEYRRIYAMLKKQN